jgi:hypothetical protein
MTGLSLQAWHTHEARWTRRACLEVLKAARLSRASLIWGVQSWSSTLKGRSTCTNAHTRLERIKMKQLEMSQLSCSALWRSARLRSTQAPRHQALEWDAALRQMGDSNPLHAGLHFISVSSKTQM